MAGKPPIPAWKAPLLVAAQARHQAKPKKPKTYSTTVPGTTLTRDPVTGDLTGIGVPGGGVGQPYTGPAGSSAPAAPPPPVATPAAPAWQDSTYGTAITNLQGNLGNIKSNIINQGVGLGQDYGIDYTGDPVSGASGFKIDPNVDIKNPFSRAALLKRSYQAQSRGDGNRMAAGGQLYSGAYQNAQDTDTRNFQGGQNSLINEFSGKFGGLLGSWLAAQGTESAGEGTAASDAIGRWIASGSPAPAPSPVQIAAAKQFGQPVSNAASIALGPETNTSTTHAKPKPAKPGKGVLTVVKPKGKK